MSKLTQAQKAKNRSNKLKRERQQTIDKWNLKSPEEKYKIYKQLQIESQKAWNESSLS